jgi:hypothetical protein
LLLPFAPICEIAFSRSSSKVELGLFVVVAAEATKQQETAENQMLQTKSRMKDPEIVVAKFML